MFKIYITAFVSLLLINSVFSNISIEEGEDFPEPEEINGHKAQDLIKTNPDDDTVSAEFMKEKYGMDLGFMGTTKFSKDVAQ